MVVNPERIETEGEARARAAQVPVRTRRRLHGELARRARARQASPRGSRLCTDRPRPEVRGGVAWLATLPRVRLVIVGAGHVGQAVASLAAQADFDVWVIDDRSQYANPERFPTAQQILVGPDRGGARLARGHAPHLRADRHPRPRARPGSPLSPGPDGRAPYVGLIGSRRKIKLIFESLRDAGIAEADLARVAAPVGLDIGSQTVPEIAISIVAELIARRNLGPRGLATPATLPRAVMSSTTDSRHRPGRGQEPADGPAQAAPAVRRPAADRPRRLGAARGGRRARLSSSRHRPSRRKARPSPRPPGRPGPTVITPRARPAEMRESVELALEQLGRDGPPSGVPADARRQPGHHAGDCPSGPGAIGAGTPARSSSRAPRDAAAHPIVLPWDLASQIPTLPRHQGINALVTAHPERVVEIEVPHPGAGRRAQYARGPRALAATPAGPSLTDPPLRRGQGAGRTSRDRARSPLAGDRRRSSPGPCLATPRARSAGSQRARSPWIPSTRPMPRSSFPAPRWR